MLCNGIHFRAVVRLETHHALHDGMISNCGGCLQHPLDMQSLLQQFQSSEGFFLSYLLHENEAFPVHNSDSALTELSDEEETRCDSDPALMEIPGEEEPGPEIPAAMKAVLLQRCVDIHLIYFNFVVQGPRFTFGGF